MIAWILGLFLLLPTPSQPSVYKLRLPFIPIYKLISSNGRVLTIVDKRRDIHLISLPTGQELRTVDGHHAIDGAFSPGGKWFAVITTDSSVIAYSTKGNITQRWKVNAHIWTMDFLPNDLLLVNHTLWNIHNKQPVTTLVTDFGEVNTGTVSPDGMHLATGGGDTTVRFYTAQSGNTTDPDWKLAHQYTGLKLEPFGMTFTPDGKHVVAGGIDDQIVVLATATGKAVKTLHTGTNGVQGILPIEGNWMAVQFFNARTNRQKAWQLVNINTGVSKPLGGANTLVSVSDGKIWRYTIKGDTLRATREVIPEE